MPQDVSSHLFSSAPGVHWAGELVTWDSTGMGVSLGTCSLALMASLPTAYSGLPDSDHGAYVCITARAPRPLSAAPALHLTFLQSHI